MLEEAEISQGKSIPQSNTPLPAEPATIIDPVANQESPAKFSYEMSSKDIEELETGADLMEESNLFVPEVLDNIRMVSFDSEYLYVLTKGQHQSNDRYSVKRISTSKKGFNTYKIKHSGSIGRQRKDYRCGLARGMAFDEVETTAAGAKMYPYESDDRSKVISLLMTVRIPPPTPYNEFHQGKYDVLCDLQFHEAGHKQHERLIDWKPGEENYFFSTEEKRQSFLETIYDNTLVPEAAKEIIYNNLGSGLSEIYAILIGREAKRRYNPTLYNQENKWFAGDLALIQRLAAEPDKLPELNHMLQNFHINGGLLLRLVEEKYPDFQERKKYIESLMGAYHSQTLQDTQALAK